MAQRQDGSTVNATISQNANTGQYVFTFNDPFNMLFNLNNSADFAIQGTTLNDRFNLLNSSGLTLNGGKGNNIFALGTAAADLNGNLLKGGTAVDFVTYGASGQAIDLTQGAAGIEAVVGRRNLSAENVTLRLDQLTASSLTNGGTGRAFAAVVGSDGQVNVIETGRFKLVGVVDAAGNGYDAAGASITGAALAQLQGSVTSVAKITGNLAAMYAGTTSVPARETHIANELNAYVFSDGSKNYTVWSDGTVSRLDRTGTPISDAYHPVAAAPAVAPTYGVVETYSKDTESASATITVNAIGMPQLQLNDGTTMGSSAVVLRAGVTGVKVIGDSGINGPNWFGLGQSGGLNQIVGSKAGNIYDLQLSPSLQDQILGGVGADIVRATADGSDVDLTANNGFTSLASTSIEGVAGSLRGIQTVELDFGKLRFTTDALGGKGAVFSAMLGSADDTLNLSGLGRWNEVATFKPGDALPDHASGLVGADLLKQAFGPGPYNPETALTGHLFAQVNNQGAAIKYVTIYTDATIESTLLPPIGNHMVIDSFQP